MQHYPLIILGSGPAGCTAAVYAARANLGVAVIAGSEPGGQLMRTTDVDNWPGDVHGLQGPALMERMIEHIKHYNVPIIYDHIEKVQLDVRPFILKGRETYSADALIIATGARAKYLGLESEEKFMGRGVSACATCDGFFYKKQVVAVIGGGNTAVEEALYLSNIAEKVIVVHRRQEFRCERILLTRMMDKVRDGKIILYTDHVLHEVLGDATGVTGMRLQSTLDNTTTDISVHGVFIAIGHEPNTHLFQDSLQHTNGYIITQSGHNGMATATSVPGVFASGDVADHVYRQAITSAGTGCMAALDAEKYLMQHKV